MDDEKMNKEILKKENESKNNENNNKSNNERRKMKVIIDTNFLLLPFTEGVDIFEELKRVMNIPYEIIILEGTIHELEKIKKQGGNDGRAAKMALELVEIKKNKIEKPLKIEPSSNHYVDDAIIEIADDETAVCTLDAELKRSLKKRGSRIITLRQRKYLVIEEP